MRLAIELPEILNHYCETHNIAVIIPADVTANLAILSNQDKIKAATLFPSPTYEKFRELNNKWLFAQIASACQAEHPQSHLLESVGQIDEFKLKYPVIVKPLIGTSGVDVFIIRSRDKLIECFSYYAKKNQIPFLVQNFIKGYDLDLTILANLR